MNELWKVWKVWKLFFRNHENRPENEQTIVSKSRMESGNYPIGIRYVRGYDPDGDMNLKQARHSGKLAQFIQQHQKTHPHTRKYRFRAVVKLMALNKPKSKRGRPRTT